MFYSSSPVITNSSVLFYKCFPFLGLCYQWAKMLPTDEERCFSLSVEAFSLLCSGNLPKGKDITILNTVWIADVNSMERWTSAADWRCRDFTKVVLCISLHLRFLSSICVRENKDSSNHSSKEVQEVFSLHEFCPFWFGSDLRKPDPTIADENSLGR